MEEKGEKKKNQNTPAEIGALTSSAQITADAHSRAISAPLLSLACCIVLVKRSAPAKEMISLHASTNSINAALAA